MSHRFGDFTYEELVLLGYALEGLMEKQHKSLDNLSSRELQYAHRELFKSTNKLRDEVLATMNALICDEFEQK